MDLQVKLGLTFMVVTHDQEEAMTMSDRIAVMDKGRIMQVATPAEVYEAPGSKFVADFIGNVNIIEGEVVKAANGEAEIATEKFGFNIQTETREQLSAGQKVWYAVRPEKTRITREKPEETSVNAVEGELWDIAYFGDMTVFHVRLDNGRTIKAASLNAVRKTENPLTYDERVWVSFDTDAGLVLTA
jgi:putrescine transport system ATP-binding protein